MHNICVYYFYESRAGGFFLTEPNFQIRTDGGLLPPRMGGSGDWLAKVV